MKKKYNRALALKTYEEDVMPRELRNNEEPTEDDKAAELGVEFEATGHHEPAPETPDLEQPDKPQDELVEKIEEIKEKLGRVEKSIDNHATMDATTTPEEIEAAEAERKRRFIELQKTQAKGREHLGPPPPNQVQADASRVQSFIDDIFKCVATHQPSNIVAIAVLELVKDEYIKLAKQPPPPPPTQNIVTPGAGGIVGPGGQPIRGGRA